MNQIKIMEYNDSKIDIYARLNEAQLFHYYEPDAGIFIAESPGVDSLNVAAASAVAFWELGR